MLLIIGHAPKYGQLWRNKLFFVTRVVSFIYWVEAVGRGISSVFLNCPVLPTQPRKSDIFPKGANTGSPGYASFLEASAVIKQGLEDWILPARGLPVDLNDLLPSITLPLVLTYHVTPFPKLNLRSPLSAASLITITNCGAADLLDL